MTKALRLAAAVVPGCDVYLFGAVLKGVVDISDVDVLVVYRGVEDTKSIRDAIFPLTLRFPLDVTYMSESEERGFDFIRQQGARLVGDVVRHLEQGGP